ncbi:MAG: hypothetical protein AAF580_10220 [Pseudomonadota bacterium]
MRLLDAVVMSGVFIIAAGTAANAQTNAVDVARAIFNGYNVTHRPSIQYLAGEQLTVYTIENSTFYVPRPTPDWAAFRADFEGACAEKDGAVPEGEVKLRFPILYYNDEIVGELARAVGTDPAKMEYIPHFARTVTVEIDGIRLKIRTTSVDTAFEERTILFEGAQLPSVVTVAIAAS